MNGRDLGLTKMAKPTSKYDNADRGNPSIDRATRTSTLTRPDPTRPMEIAPAPPLSADHRDVDVVPEDATADKMTTPSENAVSSSAAAKYDDDEEEEDVCRICRNPSDNDNPLRYPCACSGSIKFVHQDCLLQWLNHSNARQCELGHHSLNGSKGKSFFLHDKYYSQGIFSRSY